MQRNAASQPYIGAKVAKSFMREGLSELKWTHFVNRILIFTILPNETRICIIIKDRMLILLLLWIIYGINYKWNV